MGQVTVTINGRTYRLRCRDGEEERVLAVAGRVRACVDALRVEFGTVGDDRLLLMAALLLGDELLEAEERLAGSHGKTPGPHVLGFGPADPPPPRWPRR